MKYHWRSYRIAALLMVMAVLGGCAAGPSGPAAQTRAASGVVDSYQVVGLLSQAGPAVSASLSKNLPDDVLPVDRQRLDTVIAHAYATPSLRQNVVDRLKQHTADAGHEKYLVEAADNLSKPLAQRMIGLERKVSNPGFGQGFSQFVNKPAGRQRKQRLKIIDQLADDMQVTNLQTDFNVTLLNAMIKARNAAVSGDEQVDDARIQRILSNSRDGISAKLDQQVPLMLLYVYRHVDTPTLREYASLQHQPEMVWTNQALAQAIIGALSGAGEDVPQQFNAED